MQWEFWGLLGLRKMASLSRKPTQRALCGRSLRIGTNWKNGLSVRFYTHLVEVVSMLVDRQRNRLIY
jgi:hypothetical protein